MKRLPFLLISLLLLCAFGCSNGKADKVMADSTPSSDNLSIRNQEIKEFRTKTLEAFLATDEESIKEREELYFQLLQQLENHEPTCKDSLWYRENILHVDSIARYCIGLNENNDTVRLLEILESELPNFQSHPNADTYLCFDLNIVLTQLYTAQDNSDCKEKCVRLWELNKVQIEAAQSGWNEYHPLYKEVLKILSGLYRSIGNTDEALEIEKTLQDITPDK